MKDKTVRLIGTVLIISIPILFSCASNHRMQTKQAEAYFDLGTKHLQQGEYDQAISGYNKALELIGELPTGTKANMIRPSPITIRFFR